MDADTHYRGPDGWLHCPEESRAEDVGRTSDGGRAVAVRCAHESYPLRYEAVPEVTGADR